MNTLPILTSDPRKRGFLALVLALIFILAASVTHAQVPPAKPDTTMKPLQPDTTQRDPRVRIDTTQTPNRPVRPKTIIIAEENFGTNAPPDTLLRKDLPSREVPGSNPSTPPAPTAPTTLPPPPKK